MEKNIYAALALFMLLTSSAQANVANVLTFDNNEHIGAATVDYFSFNVDSSTSDINIYTVSPGPYNPYLTLWSTTSSAPTAADWVKVGANDDTATLDFNETVNSFDAQLKLNLAAGTYLATVTGSGFIPAGNLLSNGFTGTSSQTFFPYQLVVAGNVSAVPLPAAVWLFGAGLMGVLGISKRKGKRV